MSNYSHSYLEKYKQCPLSCFFSYEQHLEKIDEEKSEHHLRFGSAMHQGLELLYRGDSLEAAHKAFKSIYTVQLDEEDKAKTIENGVNALTAYVQRWKEEDKKWKIVEIETKDTFAYGDEESFTVKLDIIAENKDYGGIYGWDHKIVGNKKATLSYDFWTQFEPNSQITKYVSYIKSKYGDCSGFYINAIGMRWLQKKYLDSPAGLNLRFERQMFNRNEQQIKQDSDDSQYWIERIEHSRTTGRWGMNTGNCRFCEYRNICAAGWTWETDQENILIQYNQRPRVTKQGEVNAIITGV